MNERLLAESWLFYVVDKLRISGRLRDDEGILDK